MIDTIHDRIAEVWDDNRNRIIALGTVVATVGALALGGQLLKHDPLAVVHGVESLFGPDSPTCAPVPEKAVDSMFQDLVTAHLNTDSAHMKQITPDIARPVAAKYGFSLRDTGDYKSALQAATTPQQAQATIRRLGEAFGLNVRTNSTNLSVLRTDGVELADFLALVPTEALAKINPPPIKLEATLLPGETGRVTLTGVYHMVDLSLVEQYVGYNLPHELLGHVVQITGCAPGSQFKDGQIAAANPKGYGQYTKDGRQLEGVDASKLTLDILDYHGLTNTAEDFATTADGIVTGQGDFCEQRNVPVTHKMAVVLARYNSLYPGLGDYYRDLRNIRCGT